MTPTAIKVAGLPSWFQITQEKRCPSNLVTPDPKPPTSEWSSQLLSPTHLKLTRTSSELPRFHTVKWCPFSVPGKQKNGCKSDGQLHTSGPRHQDTYAVAPRDHAAICVAYTSFLSLPLFARGNAPIPASSILKLRFVKPQDTKGTHGWQLCGGKLPPASFSSARLLSHTSPGFGPGPCRPSCHDVGVQVNQRCDPSVQCMLGGRHPAPGRDQESQPPPLASRAPLLCAHL
ncbi:PREDICTED: uncharacterized protein LOC102006347 isoform X2 [Chinchilla lanigera]|uniref:uncharacterized protein LOC102006347 isoform X2 n=1 Tax=Chinchilla lanigera TaxID=34839 RepID=UPI000697E00F|nr:PREDICTED: uncharacterized protein LOC102006347 isoform X2 [Chinchilla lanigera]